MPDNVYFREFGDPSHPPLLLIHGLFGDSSLMVPLAKRFADRFRVIAIDALGHGRSPKPAGFTLEDSGRAVTALIASLGYDSAVVLGVSMGSYVAAQAAILEPARVAQLVLVVAKGHGKTSSVAAFAERNGFDLAAATMEETIAFMTSALWSPDTAQDVRDGIMALQSEDAWQATAEERAAIEESLADFDLRPDLPSITAPTLVISGLSDGLNPPASGEEVAQLIPGARFEVYEHSGHMLASEETDRLVTDVTELVFS
jgi:3-oxoadipate enol-lactonase